MIQSFRCKDTERLFKNYSVSRFANFRTSALRKLKMLNAAHDLKDLRVPPGNRLKALKGDRQGQYSIRINEQHRVCFRWENGDAYDVEIVDYH
ncbi:type II toxin-antitoxin system RelE/ParE family toxin [Moorena sp. SIO3I6]|uniref:type II toxin-antitoxin system RelE/ParE family toxin n=1 Tax=Moorena sp. SIO3I6 TaxID=2607831 RepID=UPI0013F76662|nr:type II toxin-antitoxin system RelE/ParE family toxin [Moorena sp. SIO3I6]NEP23313.1 type II toxin-antitoxin system RelE/ParE family toxin [Moorena sp. SIO3I6]